MCYICSDKMASVIADGPYQSAIVGWNVLFQPLFFAGVSARVFPYCISQPMALAPSTAAEDPSKALIRNCALPLYALNTWLL